MFGLTTKKRTLISILLFVLIFGGLLVTATFTDLRVSEILTKNVLPAGQYYATDFFGVAFECIGTCPELIVSAVCAAMLTLYFARFCKPGAVRSLLVCLGGAGTVGLYAWEYNDLFDYICRHFDVSGDRPAFVWGIVGFLALLSAALTLFAVNGFSDESLKKLLKFSVVTMASIIVAVLIVQGLKIPFGRMRYRSMNVIGDTSGYTPWYVAGGQPDKEWMRATFGTSDAFKSFPSGHTRAAAATFYLVTLAEVIGVKSKVKKALLWCFAVVFTGAVALSRIMVGAHFFSDVLMGGTIGFLVAMLSREIFFCGGAHVKSLKQ